MIHTKFNYVLILNYRFKTYYYYSTKKMIEPPENLPFLYKKILKKCFGKKH